MWIRILGLPILSLLLLSGCASTPELEQDAGVTIFKYPIERVQQAAVDALVITGFDITKQEVTYVEGHRPHKMGLLVGSGGETVGVWLTKQAPNETEVRIDTAKSFVGIIGQKEWESDILNEMYKSLTQ